MDWLQPLDQYCERVTPEFWGEPLNAFSNAAFIIAGLVLLHQWKRNSSRSPSSLLLILNVIVIGIGSFLFHTFANRLSELADVLPIAVFINLYLFLALRAYLGLNWWLASGITIMLLVASPFIADALAPLMGPSSMYGTALLSIFGVGIAARNRSIAISNLLFIAGSVFIVSIAFRAADLRLCQSWPHGTHFAWHILNSVVLYLLAGLYLNASRGRPVSARHEAR